jgi:hypothetical protein
VIWATVAAKPARLRQRITGGALQIGGGLRGYIWQLENGRVGSAGWRYRLAPWLFSMTWAFSSKKRLLG